MSSLVLTPFVVVHAVAVAVVGHRHSSAHTDHGHPRAADPARACGQPCQQRLGKAGLDPRRQPLRGRRRVRSAVREPDRQVVYQPGRMCALPFILWWQLDAGCGAGRTRALLGALFGSGCVVCLLRLACRTSCTKLTDARSLSLCHKFGRMADARARALFRAFSALPFVFIIIFASPRPVGGPGPPAGCARHGAPRPHAPVHRGMVPVQRARMRHQRPQRRRHRCPVQAGRPALRIPLPAIPSFLPRRPPPPLHTHTYTTTTTTSTHSPTRPLTPANVSGIFVFEGSSL